MDTFGSLANLAPGISFLACTLVYLSLGFIGAHLIVWTAFTAAVLWFFGFSPVWWIVVGAPLVIFNIRPLRQMLITKSMVGVLKKLNVLPEISETERVALEAGTTWVDKDLFSGKPNLHRLIKDEPYRKVSGEELAFLKGPVEKLCEMTNDWDIYQKRDLPPEIWDYLKKEKFFGMIIPKEYGGLGFSAIANSEVVAKLSTRSMPLAVTVMVPNSLGPAELLNHYGTDEQKRYYLPRLASGEEIPCFALTEPTAGSDAGSMISFGEVFKGEDGKIYLKLNWKKRYITLAAVSTLIGLAVKLRDPNNLLGKGEHPGITCVLVPAKTKGVALGRRHDPMGVPFYNCPTEGHDVVVSIDQIIGGKEGAGRGWQMLMECLAAGRSVSLPAQTTGGSKYVSRITSAYASFRKQFGVPIGKFEGVEEVLARIFGITYILEASRIFTVGAVDKGMKPSVVSAIAKYNSTEMARKIMNDGMDVLGGAAISRGPRNLLANGYIATPISITVEGANILTRCMIIFGQGALRCHPYTYQELKALGEGNIKEFDKAFWGHVGFSIRNTCRSVFLSVTRGRLASTPGGPAKRYYQKLAWASASFAIMADIAMGAFGGKLKFREKITGRYADILSWMYLATAALKRFETEGRRADHLPFLQWSMDFAFARIQEAFDGLFANFDAPVIKYALKPILWWSRFNRMASEPSDSLGHTIVSAMLKPGELRDSMTAGIYVPTSKTEALGRYEHAMVIMYEAEAIFRKIGQASREKRIAKGRPVQLINEALTAGVINKEEATIARNAEAAYLDAIEVDSYKLEDYATGTVDTPKPNLASVGNGL